MDLDAEDIARFASAIGRFEKVLDGITKTESRVVGNSTISVSAGNPAMWIAVWISTICCAIVVTMTWNWREEQTKQVVSSAEQEHKLENANDKLSIILQWAPKLAKEVDDQMKQKDIHHEQSKP